MRVANCGCCSNQALVESLHRFFVALRRAEGRGVGVDEIDVCRRLWVSFDLGHLGRNWLGHLTFLLG